MKPVILHDCYVIHGVFNLNIKLYSKHLIGCPIMPRVSEITTYFIWLIHEVDNFCHRKYYDCN